MDPQRHYTVAPTPRMDPQYSHVGLIKTSAHTRTSDISSQLTANKEAQTSGFKLQTYSPVSSNIPPQNLYPPQSLPRKSPLRTSILSFAHWVSLSNGAF
jgi:hypothetical protein